MKTQIKFQKILALVTLITAALTFIYALIFFSGNLSGDGLMFYLGRNEVDGYYTGADGFLLPAQTFVGTLIGLGIAFIIVAAAQYLTATASRRNYYVSNYVSSGLAILTGAVIALFGIIYLSILVSEFYAIDWAELQELIEGLKATHNPYKEVTQSPAMFILGYVMFMIVLADAAAWALNLVWKIKLMRGEKELLSRVPVKEAA